MRAAVALALSLIACGGATSGGVDTTTEPSCPPWDMGAEYHATGHTIDGTCEDPIASDGVRLGDWTADGCDRADTVSPDRCHLAIELRCYEPADGGASFVLEQSPDGSRAVGTIAVEGPQCSGTFEVILTREGR